MNVKPIYPKREKIGIEVGNIRFMYDENREVVSTFFDGKVDRVLNKDEVIELSQSLLSLVEDKRKYKNGDEVIINDGDLAGTPATIIDYYETTAEYSVRTSDMFSSDLIYKTTQLIPRKKG